MLLCHVRLTFGCSRGASDLRRGARVNSKRTALSACEEVPAREHPNRRRGRCAASGPVATRSKTSPGGQAACDSSVTRARDRAAATPSSPHPRYSTALLTMSRRMHRHRRPAGVPARTMAAPSTQPEEDHHGLQDDVHDRPRPPWSSVSDAGAAARRRVLDELPRDDGAQEARPMAANGCRAPLADTRGRARAREAANGSATATARTPIGSAVNMSACQLNGVVAAAATEYGRGQSDATARHRSRAAASTAKLRARRRRRRPTRGSVADVGGPGAPNALTRADADRTGRIDVRCR